MSGLVRSFARIASTLLLCLGAGIAPAQSVKDAYVQDARGQVLRNAGVGDARIGNLCVRTGYWTPALAIAECDADIAPSPAPKPKPAAAAAPPKPAPSPPKPAPATAPRDCDFADTLGADESFVFGQSQLRPAARAKLDAIVARAAGTCARIAQVIVTGHADRLGSAAYNMRLSEQRAQVVAAYLVSKGLPQAKVSGAGAGAPLKSCHERLSRSALIECLAPNRRVAIEVRGSGK